MSISPLGGVTGQLWRKILKGNQRLPTSVYLTILLYHAQFMSFKLFSIILLQTGSDVISISPPVGVTGQIWRQILKGNQRLTISV